VRTDLSPRWGLSASAFTHGLRRGLHSCAASRLWAPRFGGPDFDLPRRRNSGSHTHADEAAEIKIKCSFEFPATSAPLKIKWGFEFPATSEC
jgi:hypothetical protein